MATKWKTTIICHNYTLPSDADRSAIQFQINAWNKQGVYSGSVEAGPVPGSPQDFMWHLWWWDSEKSARDYVDFIRPFYSTKELSVDVVSEELPD